MDPSSCPLILPTDAPLPGVVTVLWAPLLILVQPHLLASEDGTKGNMKHGGGLELEGMTKVGSPGELSPGGLGGQECHVST